MSDLDLFSADAPSGAPTRDKRVLLIVAGVAAAVALLLLGWAFLLPGAGDDAGTTDPATAVRRPAAAGAAPGAIAQPAGKAAVIPATYSDVVGRDDPFRPLYVAPASGGGTAAGGFDPAPGGAATGGAATAPSGSAPPADSAGPAGGAANPSDSAPPADGAANPSDSGSGESADPRAGSSTTSGGNRVALIQVFSKGGKQYAQTKVGDKVHTPVVGAVFAGNYKLLAVDGDCATYLFGDEQFNLCEGQEVLK